MIDWSSCSAVERDPSRVSGAWVFKGTRVPVATLFENVAADASLQQFVDWFPGVTLEQVQSVLEFAARESSAPSGNALGLKLLQSVGEMNAGQRARETVVVSREIAKSRRDPTTS